MDTQGSRLDEFDDEADETILMAIGGLDEEDDENNS